MILDLMLPTMNGFTVLQRLRDEGRDIPVLIMTALGTEEEKLRGFGLGANDYVVKPCGLLEILARVRALLKRASATGSQPRPETRVGDLTIDFGARMVRRGPKRSAAAQGVRPAGRARSPSRARGLTRRSAARSVGIRGRHGESHGGDASGGAARASW